MREIEKTGPVRLGWSQRVAGRWSNDRELRHFVIAALLTLFFALLLVLQLVGR